MKAAPRCTKTKGCPAGGPLPRSGHSRADSEDQKSLNKLLGKSNSRGSALSQGHPGDSDEKKCLKIRERFFKRHPEDKGRFSKKALLKKIEESFNTTPADFEKALTKAELIRKKADVIPPLHKGGFYRKRYKILCEIKDKFGFIKNDTIVKILKLWKKDNILWWPLSDKEKYLKRHVDAIRATIFGKVNIDIPEYPNGKKYGFMHWSKVISRLKEMATTTKYGEKTHQWAKKVTINDLVYGSFFNKDSTLLKYRCPFYHILMMDNENFPSVKDSNDFNKTVSLIKEYLDFTLNDENRKIIRIFRGKVKTFIKENKYGFQNYDFHFIVEQYLKFVFDGKDYDEIKGLIWDSKWNDFFNHCLDTDILYDPFFGKRTFDVDGFEKYWFQLTDEQRKRIEKMDSEKLKYLTNDGNSNKKEEKMSMKDLKNKVANDEKRRILLKEKLACRDIAKEQGRLEEFDSVCEKNRIRGMEFLVGLLKRKFGQ